MSPTLDHLLTAIDVDPYVFSVCRIQAGWRMTFPVFQVATVHFVLRGSGHLQIGVHQPATSFAAPHVLIVPAGESHWVGETGDQAKVRNAAGQCALLGDGLIKFTAGSGDGDILMLCRALAAPHQGAPNSFDLLQSSVATSVVANCIPSYVFDAMANEIASAGLGTQAMCQALLKQGLIALLRAGWSGNERGEFLAHALHHPRLSRAIAIVIENPAASHAVESLASLAGMSRASFSDHFLRTQPDSDTDRQQVPEHCTAAETE